MVLLLLQVAAAQHAALLEHRAEAFRGAMTARRVMYIWLMSCQEARLMSRAMAQARIGTLRRAVHVWSAVVRRLSALLSVAGDETVLKSRSTVRLLCMIMSCLLSGYAGVPLSKVV